MRRWTSLRISAIGCAIALLLILGQSGVASATLPNTGSGEYNHALRIRGGVATSSGASGTYTPDKAIDGVTSTYWQSSTSTGWLAVAFPSNALVNEIHVHFHKSYYPAISLYFDTNGNGSYETAERIWRTTTNKVLDVVVTTGTMETRGVKVTIDAKLSSRVPRIAEFEAFLRHDSDGDGLTNSAELSTVFHQDVTAGGLPLVIPDDGTNATAAIAALAEFRGNSHKALAQFAVDHPLRTDMTASVGYWNGTAWTDRTVWDPGRRGSGVSSPSLVSLPIDDVARPPRRVLGLLGSEWTVGEVVVGTRSTIVVDLTSSLEAVTPQEIAAGILRPAFPASAFHDYLQWRLIVRDASAGTMGRLLEFILRAEARTDPLDQDSDDDTLSDRIEVASLGTIPVAPDSDVDGLRDGEERVPRTLTITIDGVDRVFSGIQTDPTRGDTDGDGLGDGYEVQWRTHPLLPDTDNDGLSDGAEVSAHGSDPTRTDSDADTIPDFVEVTAADLVLRINGATVVRSITTLAYAEDTDGDGIADAEEKFGTSRWAAVTDPADPDTDDDGIPDGGEAFIKEFGLGGRAPLGAGGSRTVSAFAQGAVEAVEVRYALTGMDMSSAQIRLDHEGAMGPLLPTSAGSYLHESKDVTGAFPGHSPTGAYTLLVSAPAGSAVLEEFSIRLRIRTSPIAADTDGDGLADREELESGSDGYLTDPNAGDTDGDGWGDGYEVSRGTSPRHADTDADGVPDPADVDPWRNLLVAVSVYRVHHGSPAWTPVLQGVVEMNGDYVYATPRVGASQDWVCAWSYWDIWSWSSKCGGWMATTSPIYVTYYADVPDDRWDVRVKVQGWSINDLRQDDLLVNREITYWHGNYYGETAYNGGHWISWGVSTVRLDRVRTLAITDGVFTSKDRFGADRYPSEERFTVFLIHASYSYGAIAAGFNAIVVPEALFGNTHLKARLDRSDPWPLGGATFYEGDTARASMSESIVGLVAGNLDGYEAWLVLQWLLQDATGTYVYRAIDAAGRISALNLPHDVVRIIPWVGVSNAPTGAWPEGNFWAKVWNGVVAVSLLVYGGLLAIGNFFYQLGQTIVDWGMRALGAVANVINEVKASVDRAVQTFVAALNWIQDLVLRLFRSLIDRLADALKDLVRGIVEKIGRIVANVPSLDEVLERLPEVLSEVLRVTSEIIGFFLALEVAELALTAVIAVMSAGAAALVKTAVAGVVRQSALDVILRTIVFAAVADLSIRVVESFDEDAVHSHIGEGFKRIVGGVRFVTGIFAVLNGFFRARGGGLTQFAAAAGLALMSLLVGLFGGSLLGDVLNGLGVTNPFAPGLGLFVVHGIAFMLAVMGILQHLDKAGAPAKVVRQSFLSITDGVETLLVFAAVGTSMVSFASDLRILQ